MALKPPQPADLMAADILAQPAYSVADATGLVKLDAMENPWPFPGPLEREFHAALAGAALNRYPDPSGRQVVEALRAAGMLPAALPALLGNGSDELIQILIQAVAASGRPILSPVPTFVMYAVLARAFGVPFVGVPLRADFALDVDALCAAIRRERPAMVFLAHPNNPTGRPFAPDDVLAVHAAMQSLERPGLAPGLTIVDEAYSAFAEHSFLPELEQRPGMLVLRTLSKLGLAGIRLGYLAGAPEWIDALDRLRLPYNINSLTQRAAVFALQHQSVLTEQAAGIRAQRAQLAASLAALPGVRDVVPSACNFLLFRVAPGEADRVFAGLRERGVLIKNVAHAHPLLADALRVTVGTPAENQRFLAALAAALAAPSASQPDR